MTPYSSPQDSDIFTRLRLLESFVTNANDAILITEAEPIGLPGPIIMYVNPAFTKMTGYSPDEVLGKSPRLLQGPLSSSIASAKIKAALLHWEPLEIELLNYRKDGTTFWVELSISPVCDEKGWYTHWVSIQRDITHRKEVAEAQHRRRSAERQNKRLRDQISQKKIVEATLTHAAFHDGLTGLRNRAFFNDLLETSLKRAQSSRDYNAALIFLDLDGFKSVNDKMGHHIGDRLLVEISSRLLGSARVQDTVARLGGDEFTILLDGLINMDAAEQVVNRVLKAVSRPFVISGLQLQVTASLGLCQITRAYVNPTHILRDADTSMYEAKRQGGNRAVKFDASMRLLADNLFHGASEMRQALAHGEFELYYQPLVTIGDGSIYGVEALIRWNHPVRGRIHPKEFIALAEETGLIHEIGHWVINQAISDMRQFAEVQKYGLVVSINVSGKQLETDSIVDYLASALDPALLGSCVLQLEITESVLLQDLERVGKLLVAIRKLGVRIAFDDFGTGYSSISYLTRFPVDMMKIDQCFIRNLGAHPADVVLIDMMVNLAIIFNMEIVAEGVENETQAGIVHSCGCPVAQGYLYGKPTPLCQILELLLLKAA